MTLRDLRDALNEIDEKFLDKPAFCAQTDKQVTVATVSRALIDCEIGVYHAVWLKEGEYFLECYPQSH